MVGEYVRVKQDVVVVGDASSLLPSIGGTRRTRSDLEQVKCLPGGYFTLNCRFLGVFTSSLGDSLPKESVSSPPLIGFPAWLAGRVGIDIDRS